MSDGSDIVTRQAAAPAHPPKPGDGHPLAFESTSIPEPLPTPALSAPSDTTVAMARVVAYLHALGVGDPVARQVAVKLDTRVGSQVTDAAQRAEAMLAALDQWCDALPEVLGRERDAARVALALSRKLGLWLTAKPEALDDPTVLVSELTHELEHWPHGVLPVLPRQTMHRQPLGELPAVLRGAFWSGTYRWVLPQANRDVGPTSAVKDKT